MQHEIEQAAALHDRVLHQEETTSTRFDPAGTPVMRVHDLDPSYLSRVRQMDMSLSVEEGLLVDVVQDDSGQGKSKIWLRDINNSTSVALDTL